jgi:hypothetical protein
MSQASEQQFDLFAEWFENNYGRYPIISQEQRWDFTVKSLQNMALILAKIIGDLQKLEQREKSPKLYLPSGLRYRGDLTRVG